jgi:glutathione S-transferase
MPNKLYVIPGSHPCATAIAALKLKGVEYKRIDCIPQVHRLQAKLAYGERTVPGMKLEGGDKIVGSRTILRWLDETVPEPRLYPEDPALLAQVEEAEAWGDEVLQPLARRLSWAVLKRTPKSMEGYAEGAKLPVPTPLARPGYPVIARLSARLNHENDENTKADLAALPGHLDRIDAWIAAGVMGGAQPNAADLQLGGSLGLLLSLGDIAPLIAGRPVARLARYVPSPTGTAPAGTLPSDWLTGTTNA